MLLSRKKNAVGVMALLVGAYLLLTLFTKNTYYQHILTIVPIYAVLGLSWNLLGGYAGAVSFGHSAFFGAGAFAVTILFAMFGVSPWIGIPVGVLVGSVLGTVIGFPTFRLRGVY